MEAHPWNEVEDTKLHEIEYKKYSDDLLKEMRENARKKIKEDGER